MIRPNLGLLLTLVCCCVPGVCDSGEIPWSFSDQTLEAGLYYEHGYLEGIYNVEARWCAGGVACADYNQDGWPDLYVVSGDIGHNRLFQNAGDGTFEDVSVEAGVAISGERSSGPLFFDCDGDGWLDLFVGGVADTAPRLFKNQGDGTFLEISAGSGLRVPYDTFSAAAADFNQDGLLDLATTHWGVSPPGNVLWKNVGGGRFEPADGEAGLSLGLLEEVAYSFTPSFGDLNGDSWPDLVISGDFGTSQGFLNIEGMFQPLSQELFTDENGMGGTLGDYDNDGDLDWFVSSIWQEGEPSGLPWGTTGNRLYQNNGAGTFIDVTNEAGVRRGYWGWGSSFADLNNDGHLDLVIVNGWQSDLAGFVEDPVLIYIANGDGTFTDRAQELGGDVSSLGRGVVCFDYDQDGDIDIFIANSTQPPILLRNDLSSNANFLRVKIVDSGPNPFAVGARVTIRTGERTQVKTVQAGSTYLSQNPFDFHFGLGIAESVDKVVVHWPDGSQTRCRDLQVNQTLVIKSRRAQVGGSSTQIRAFPNPFQETTAIRVSGMSSTEAKEALVVSVTGRIIKRINLRGNGPNSDCIGHWDGSDSNGDPVSPGTYWITLWDFEAKACQVTLLK